MNNKKTRIAIISVVVLLLVLIGVTYAYWLVTKTQTNSNIISSACLDITLDNESNDISLSSQYPMSDEEGMKLTPYTFKVTNNCNTSIDYQVALESIGDEESAIKAGAIKVAINNSIRLLSTGGTMEPSIIGAYESNSLGYGTLAASESEGSSKTFSLRIWIDEDAPISEANKTFQSKISVTIGQGIKNPYNEGTMAYDILANNNGMSSITEIDETEKTENIVENQNVSMSGAGHFATSYTLDESTGTYTLSGDVVYARLSECRDGTKTCGRYTIGNRGGYWVTWSQSGESLLEVTDFKSSGSYVTANVIKYINEFGMPTTENEAGLYKTIDDLGESYYYRGNVENNYVQVGSYAAGSTILKYNDEWGEYESVTIAEALPMYWRIVRINGDGTIRLAYDGTAKVKNGTTHSAIIGNTTYNAEDTLNVNYGDSDIKGVVDTWYNTHLKTNYGGYIADGIFCNDKVITQFEYYDELGNPTTDREEAMEISDYYAPYTRLDVLSPNPKLTCTRLEDRYTTTATLGNGLLEHPIGVLTADEAMFAGVSATANKNNYLYSGEYFWTLSPVGANDIDLHIAQIWGISGNNVIGALLADDDARGARPVINLRADVEFTGDGSFETPYVIKTN